MPTIKKLSPTLISKIAAGEVVERPASILKELIENAIDAQSTQITVNIEKGGMKSVQVVDNGVGMDKRDAKLAFQQHSTSKISNEEDLGKIETMGFRGEALSSIASVSKISLVTKPLKSNVLQATSVLLEGGKVIRVEETSGPGGTSIKVSDVFYNTPARRKFLKTENTELFHCLKTFTEHALANPGIHFRLSHNGRQIYNLPPVGDPAQLSRLRELTSSGIADNLVPLFYDGVLKISGFTTHPKAAISRKNHQYIFLNKRPVREAAVIKAAADAYQGFIPKDKYPPYFIFIQIDPAKVDVNVHPRKQEVKFENPSEVYKAVKSAVEAALEKGTKEHKADRPLTMDHGRSASSYRPSAISYQPSAKTKISEPIVPYGSARKPTAKQALDFTKSLLSEEVEVQEGSFSSLVNLNLFQVFNSYIIVEKEDVIQIIDQHAAAERMTFEKLKKQFKKGKIEVQGMLVPETVKLQKGEFDLIMEQSEWLKKFGVKIEEFGKSTVAISEIPALISKTDLKSLLIDILEVLSETEIKEAASHQLSAISHQLLETIACHTSIRSGMRLERGEMLNLFNDLENAPNNYSCPHGRPIRWEIGKEELAKKFKRK